MRSRVDAQKAPKVRGGAWAAGGTTYAEGQGAVTPMRRVQESGWSAWLPQVAKGFREFFIPEKLGPTKCG